MHLKSLTLRGFKSFASSTTLRFEPGITCVVGPNGSGKSNVVDALTWVMGEQGAKSLRGGKMEDVIFAGTAGRPPLGRAEVVLTIDNSDGALPIDYTEVTISRIMFRNGGSEYAINGDVCRLLDIQELLSDSGIGREMHVVVGQGQLDAVLSASPEDRRGFIEEAAGVLKHRKRKEKALRKLDAMQANVTRVQDLNSELRRQLKPLGQQAEIARRASVIQADQRDARLRLLADDLLGLRSALAEEIADETSLRQRRAEVETALGSRGRRAEELESAEASSATAVTRAQETYFRLVSVRDRMVATRELASQRAHHLRAATFDPRPGRDPDRTGGGGPARHRRGAAPRRRSGERPAAARGRDGGTRNCRAGAGCGRRPRACSRSGGSRPKGRTRPAQRPRPGRAQPTGRLRRGDPAPRRGAGRCARAGRRRTGGVHGRGEPGRRHGCRRGRSGHRVRDGRRRRSPPQRWTSPPSGRRSGTPNATERRMQPATRPCG